MSEPLNPVMVHGAHAAAAAAIFGALAAAGFPPEVLSANGWLAPIGVVHAGILMGNVAMGYLAGRPDAASELAAAGRREDLEDSRNIVVQQLRALEAERHKLSDADYEEERANLMSVGAEALRQLAEGSASTPPPGTKPPADDDSVLGQLRSMRESDPDGYAAAMAELGLARAKPAGISGEWRGAFFTLVLVALAALLFTMAGQGSHDRAAGMTMTGGDQVGDGAPSQAARPADPREQEIRKRIDNNPNDIEALNELTELSIARQDLQTAMESNAKVLELDPKSKDARVFQAVLRAFIGRRDEAMQTLDEVSAEDPTYQRALVYKGLLSMRTDPAVAAEAFEKALAIEDTPQIRQALAEARRASAGGGGAPTPPMPSAAPAPTGDAETLLTGTISLAEGVAAEGHTLFVYLRPAGQTAGPPLGALKLAPGPFPMDFTFTSANLIRMGQARPVPALLSIGVRLDADGNAMSKAEGEPSGSADGVAKGSEGVQIELR